MLGFLLRQLKWWMLDQPQQLLEVYLAENIALLAEEAKKKKRDQSEKKPK